MPSPIVQDDSTESDDAEEVEEGEPPLRETPDSMDVSVPTTREEDDDPTELSLLPDQTVSMEDTDANPPEPPGSVEELSLLPDQTVSAESDEEQLVAGRPVAPGLREDQATPPSALSERQHRGPARTGSGRAVRPVERFGSA